MIEDGERTRSAAVVSQAAQASLKRTEVAVFLQLHDLISGALDFEDIKPLKGKS